MNTKNRNGNRKIQNQNRNKKRGNKPLNKRQKKMNKYYSFMREEVEGEVVIDAEFDIKNQPEEDPDLEQLEIPFNSGYEALKYYNA